MVEEEEELGAAWLRKLVLSEVVGRLLGALATVECVLLL